MIRILSELMSVQVLSELMPFGMGSFAELIPLDMGSFRSLCLLAKVPIGIGAFWPHG